MSGSRNARANRCWDRLPSLPPLSGGSCYIWCPPPTPPSHPSDLTPPLSIHVVLCSAAACSLISTNKFILDTNYSSATSGGAVGRSNERQQSPHHRGPPFFPLLFSWAPSVTGQQWIFVFFFSLVFLFPPQHWVKGGFFKGRRTRRVRSQGGARCSPGKGRFFISSTLRVDGSRGGGSPGDSASRASLER